MKTRIFKISKLIFFCTVFTNYVEAQTSLKGIIKDTISNKPIEFATISILKLKDSTLIGGALADEKGEFELATKETAFLLKVDFMGYQKRYFEIKSIPNSGNIGILWMQSSTKQLETVTITAEKPDAVLEIDKKVYNVEKNITSTGGSAADVLNNVPSVSVDQDGSVSLRGGGKVNILIDGRPSVLAGDSRNASLDQIPASMIESVEVITNPSAKYDPEGMSGIINIKLKKSKKAGFNTNLTAGVGSRYKSNIGMGLNYRKNKLNLGFNYSFRDNPRYITNRYDRTNYISPTIYNSFQHSDGIRSQNNHALSVSADYDLSKKHSFGISGTFGYNPSTVNERFYYLFLNKKDSLTNDFYRDINKKNNSQSGDVTVYWKKTFSKTGKELQLRSNYSSAEIENKGDFVQYNFNPETKSLLGFQRERNTNPAFYKVAGLQLDFNNTLGKESRYELGARLNAREVGSDLQFAKVDTNTLLNEAIYLPTSGLRYNETVSAAYGVWVSSIKKWKYQIGLRAENTLISISQSSNKQTNTNNYTSLFPSLHVTRTINPKLDVQYSFNKRITRPSTNQLNPFTDFSDPFNIRTGNPALKPEYHYTNELTMMYKTGIHVLTASAYHRYTDNNIFYFRKVDVTGYSTTTFNNYDGTGMFGSEFTMKNDWHKNWSLTSNLNLFNNSVAGQNSDGTVLYSTINTWIGKIISNHKLPYNFSFQLITSYNAPNVMGLGKLQAIYFTDIALKKDFLKGALSTTLTISDVFDTREMNINIINNDFNNRMKIKRESRVIQFTVNYKFGKSDLSKKKQVKIENQEGQMDF